MVANIRCREIMEDQLQSFTQDQAWQSLKAAAGKGVVPGFGQLANDLVESCITGSALTHRCMQYQSVRKQRPFASVKPTCLPTPFFFLPCNHLELLLSSGHAANGCGDCSGQAACATIFSRYWSTHTATATEGTSLAVQCPLCRI